MKRFQDESLSHGKRDATVHRIARRFDPRGHAQLRVSWLARSAGVAQGVRVGMFVEPNGSIAGPRLPHLPRSRLQRLEPGLLARGSPPLPPAAAGRSSTQRRRFPTLFPPLDKISN
jgi:hypothetical protein